MADLEERLRSTDYPGRGIFVGRSADGEKAVIAYFIMGRSQNSRNRIFVEDGEGIRTQAFDPSKMEDPSLIMPELHPQNQRRAPHRERKIQLRHVDCKEQ